MSQDQGEPGNRWVQFEDFELLQLRDSVRKVAPEAIVAGMSCAVDDRLAAQVSVASLLGLELDMSNQLHARGIDGQPDITPADIATLATAIGRGEAKPTAMADAFAAELAADPVEN